MDDNLQYKKCLKCGCATRISEPACVKCGGTEFTEMQMEFVCPYNPYIAAHLTEKGREIYERLYRGDPAAMCEYGQLLYGAAEGARDDVDGAYEWYLCAARNGYADGFYWAGSMHCNGDIPWDKDGGDFKEGIYLMKAGAKMGGAKCMYTLGRFYLTGNGVKANGSVAAEYLEGAAAAGNQDAMILLAQCLLEGRSGFAHDPERAKALYIQADAHHLMYRDFRNAYLTGSGLPKDVAKAEELGEKYLEELKRRLETDPHPDATCGYAWLIGQEYLDRDDEETAVEWFRKAMERGDVMGKISLLSLKRL